MLGFAEKLQILRTTAGLLTIGIFILVFLLARFRLFCWFGKMADKVDKEKTGFFSSAEMREFAFWVFTAISGFLAYQVWGFSSAIENLTVEVKHLAQDQTDFDGEIAALRKEITTIRLEQASRTKNVYDIGQLVSRIEKLESGKK